MKYLLPLLILIFSSCNKPEEVFTHNYELEVPNFFAATNVSRWAQSGQEMEIFAVENATNLSEEEKKEIKRKLKGNAVVRLKIKDPNNPEISISTSSNSVGVMDRIKKADAKAADFKVIESEAELVGQKKIEFSNHEK